MPSSTAPLARGEAWRALLRFHAGAGARAALRAGTIGVAALIFAVGSAPDPGDALATLVRAVVGRETPPAALPPAALPPGGLPPGGRVLYAAVAVALSAVGARRVALGATGWLRSLPVDAWTARRAAWVAAALAALPAAVFAGIALALTVWGYARLGARLDPCKVVGVPLLLAAAAAVALRVERAGARAIAALALLGAAWGTWPTLLAATGALGLWDRAAGGLAVPAPRVGVHHSERLAVGWSRDAAGERANAASTRRAGLALAARWAWRATGWRPWLDALLAAALPVAFAAFVRANNPDLAPSTRAWVARLGVSLGVAAYVGVAAGALLARRPPWPWVRSLPWSAAARVAVDAVVLGAPAAGVGVAGTVVLEALPTAASWAVRASGVVSTGGAALVIAGVTAIAAAAAVRAGAGRQTGAAGELALVGIPTAVAVAVRPTLAVAAAGLALALGALAVWRERRAAGAVRWDELRHGIEGDAGWISRV